MDKFKPAVTNTFLLFLAGIVWECVGIMLLYLAYSWLSAVSNTGVFLYWAAGALLALLIHHFGFLRIVDKNLKRIRQMNDKACFFAFYPWKSYLLVVVMVAMGSLLRHSMIPKKDLAILYIGIGLALILSSVRYIRIFYREYHFRTK
ncbi:MAG: hypothetical protein P8010_23130 [Desulfosarcinaceae bacterium]|jgi:hypothetical protein